MTSSTTIIFKIFRPSEWKKNGNKEKIPGSEDDKKDGYMHFSSLEQVEETARRHFMDVAQIIILHVDPELLGSDLKWEKSRNGDLFPHLYNDLNAKAITKISTLERHGNEPFNFENL